MADTVVSDAVKFPQDEGVGSISDGNESWDSAGYLGGLADAIGANAFVYSGMTFSNHDGTNDDISVESGRAYVRINAPDVQSGAGGNTVPPYDTTLNDGVFVMLEMPTSEAGMPLQDSTLSAVWLAYATDSSVSGVSTGDIYLRSDDTGSVTAPPHPYVKLGEANPDDATADTRANDRPDMGSVDISDGRLTGTFDANQEEIADIEQIEVGPSADNFLTLIDFFRNGNRYAFIDNSASDLRVKSDGGDIELLTSGDEGIKLKEGNGGDFTIDGKMTAATPNDTYQILLELERNGSRVGWIDNSASDFRIKAESGSDIDIVDNSNDDGIHVVAGFGDVQIDKSLEMLNEGEQIRNGFGDAYIEFDEEESLDDNTTATPFGSHQGLVVITGNSGSTALVLLANNSVTIVSSEGTYDFTSTQGNDGTVNIYHDGTDYILENKSGEDIWFDMTKMGE